MNLEEYIQDRVNKGESLEVVRADLLKDLEEGGPIFGDFKKALQPTFPNSVSRFKDGEIVIPFDEELFKKFNDLTTKLKNNKRNKSWLNVISICEEIIQLDSQARSKFILVGLFYKDTAKAYEKLGNIDNALKYYYLSKEGFLKYRKEHTLSNPDDWLHDIAIIDKKILKLTRK